MNTDDSLLTDDDVQRIAQLLPDAQVHKFAFECLELSPEYLVTSSIITDHAVYQQIYQDLQNWNKKRSYPLLDMRIYLDEAAKLNIVHKSAMGKVFNITNKELRTTKDEDGKLTKQIAVLFTPAAWLQFSTSKLELDAECFSKIAADTYMEDVGLAVLKIWKANSKIKTSHVLHDIMRAACDKGVIPRTCLQVFSPVVASLPSVADECISACDVGMELDEIELSPAAADIACSGGDKVKYPSTSNRKLEQRCIEREERRIARIKSLLLEDPRKTTQSIVIRTTSATEKVKVLSEQRTSSIHHKFVKNFTSFLDIDLDIADALLVASVLSLKEYESIFDRNTKMSRKERVRIMLRKVKQSESNVRAFHKALLEHGDARSKELAALLE